MCDYFQDILQDRSHRKVESHGRLVNFVRKYHASGLTRVYTKLQIQSLCDAYEVSHNSKSNKTSMSQDLAAAVLQAHFTPLTVPIDDREFNVVETYAVGSSIRIRLTATHRGCERNQLYYSKSIYNMIYIKQLDKLVIIIMHMQLPV